MDEREKLIGLLSDVCPNVDFDHETDLIDEGLIDSLDLVTIVSEIMEQFGVEINVNDLMPENFNSADDILALIRRKMNG